MAELEIDLATARAMIERSAQMVDAYLATHLDSEVSEDEMRSRMRDWQPPAPRYTSGVFAKYMAMVSSASEGAVTS